MGDLSIWQMDEAVFTHTMLFHTRVHPLSFSQYACISVCMCACAHVGVCVCLRLLLFT